jgi:hypothetical protein
MPASWRGMRGTVLELCPDGLHLILVAEGRKWQVPIPEAKFARQDG